MEGVKTTLTYADYVALPDDRNRYEIHDGELSVTPAPGRRHQRVPYYWIVDPEARAIDVYRLAGSSYGRPERFDGADLVDLPPFLALALDPITLWP
jgi:Uma2 family endonuclease